MITPRLYLFWLLQAAATDTIAIESEGLEPEPMRIVIESCSDAQGPQQCRLAQTEGPPPTWFARVIWEDATHLRARIELRKGARDAVLEAVRVVEFSPADEPSERYRAVGLIVASHVAERVGVEAQTPALQPAAVAAPVVVPPPPEPPAPSRRFPVAGVGLSALGGTALDRGSPRFGVTLRALARPWDEAVAPTLALSVARSAGEITVLWLSGSLGLLARMEEGGFPLALELRAELAAQRLAVEAAADGERADAGISRFGGLFGLELHLALEYGLAVFAGGELSVLLPATTVEVRGSEVGTARALGLAGLLGLRLAR